MGHLSEPDRYLGGGVCGAVWKYGTTPAAGTLPSTSNGAESAAITDIDWLGGEPALRKTTILILTVWKGLGGSIILFVAGLGGVNESYKEASQIDGANEWIIFWKITMPQLYPTIFYVLVTSVIGGMQIYVEPNLIYGDFGDTGVGTAVTPFVGYIMYV